MCLSRQVQIDQMVLKNCRQLYTNLKENDSNLLIPCSNTKKVKIYNCIYLLKYTTKISTLTKHPVLRGYDLNKHTWSIQHVQT